MSSYDLRPIVPISPEERLCFSGWTEVLESLLSRIDPGARTVIAVEVYPGIDLDSILEPLQRELAAGLVLRSQDAFYPPPRLREIFAETLTDDPVFNYMRPWTIDAYFDPEELERVRQQVSKASGTILIAGAGAAHLTEHADLLLSANLGRWEIQQRQRRHLCANLGFDNAEASPAELYKMAFFLDWRVADRERHRLYGQVDFFLDMTDESQPSMLAGDTLRAAVRQTVRQPFRVVPFFDPGPWGGQWMRRHFDLPEGPKNYAWGFDCVPEENTVLLGFGIRTFQLPAIVLVHQEPEALLGPTITNRFGAEFPIRFDFLDTVEGGNLSLQVHPNTAYIREHFGMAYTQDESYYMLHSEPGSSMFLGLKESIDPAAMAQALYDANQGGAPFHAETFVSSWPTVTHDHFSIPAGTVHCSGKGNVVLEISATPYIFTFKLWDWGRTGLDGRPRPIHLDHGLANIQWDRTAPWVARELVNPTAPIQRGDGWREEQTGLHSTEFLETRRHWFTATVPHHTEGNLQVLNLVQGPAILVASPDQAFAPLVVHYAETFIVPACVGAYTISPLQPSEQPLATLKAYVRP